MQTGGDAVLLAGQACPGGSVAAGVANDVAHERRAGPAAARADRG